MPRGQLLIWRERSLFVLTAMAVTYLAILPLGAKSNAAAVPDLFYCVTIAWVMRRPESAPVFLVAAASFLIDIVLGRPMGLWSLILVLASEYFRGRETGKGMQMRLLEWLSVSLLFLVMLIVYKFALTIGFAFSPNYTALAWHFLITALAYPFVVAVLYWGLNIRAPLPADRSRNMGRVS